MQWQYVFWQKSLLFALQSNMNKTENTIKKTLAFIFLSDRGTIMTQKIKVIISLL